MKNPRTRLITAATLLGLVLLISFAPALALKYQLRQQLLQLGAQQVQIESLYLNPWSGYVELRGLTATAANKPELRIGRLQSEIRYRALWSKHLEITQLQLADLELPLQLQDQQWHLGPLLLPLPAPDAAAERPPSAWRAGISTIELSNIHSRVSTPEVSHQLVIDQARLALLQQWTPQKQSQLSLRGRLNDSPILISTQGTPLAEQPLIELELKLQALDLGALTKPWLPEFRGTLSSDLKLQIEQREHSIHLTQSGTLSLSNGAFAQASSALSSRQIDWQGSIDLDLDEQQPPELVSKGRLRLQQLQLEQPELSLNEQQIELRGTLETDSKQLRFSGALETLPSLTGFQQLQIATQARLWQGALSVDIASAALTSLSGDIALGPLQVTQREGDTLIAFEQLDLKELQLPQPNQLDLASLELQQLVLGGEQPLLKLDQLLITAISTSAARTQIGKIHPGEIQAWLELDAELHPFRWNGWLEQLSGSRASDLPPAAKEAPPVAAAVAAEDPGYPFTLAEFALQKPALIQITEQHPAAAQARPYQATLETLRIADLDSRSDQASPFTLKARANRFGNLEITGDYTLFAATPSAHWQGSISAMELPPFSNLMQGQTGYQIDSGKLKLNTSGKITAGVVDSGNNLEIHNFIVSVGEKEATRAFNGQLGMPLATVISLLTDADDNLVLDMPIKGQLSDPEFGIQSVLNIVMTKVAREAAIGYLMISLQPYGAVIGLTRLAVDAIEGSAINLEPVYFEPGSAQLTPQGADYLSKIGALLAERSGLRLKLCGQSVSADQQWILAQRPTLPASASAAQPALPPSLTEQEQQSLLQLAEERGFRVKNQLLTQHQVNDDQLFNCRAKVDPLSQSRPQVNIGL